MADPRSTTPDDGEERAIPRWLQEHDATLAITAKERAVLREVLAGMRRVRHGSIQLAIQDGRVVQVDVTEKRRFTS